MFLVASPCVISCCLVGIILTIVYGLCATQCSYVYNDKSAFNNGMAIFLLILELIATILTTVIIIIILKTCKEFKVDVKKSMSKLFGGLKESAPEERNEQDVYNLQKWRLSVENDVNFPRIRQYLQQTRSSLGHENDVSDVEEIPTEVVKDVKDGGKNKSLTTVA